MRGTPECMLTCSSWTIHHAPFDQRSTGEAARAGMARTARRPLTTSQVLIGLLLIGCSPPPASRAAPTCSPAWWAALLDPARAPVDTPGATRTADDSLRCRCSNHLPGCH